MSIALAPNYTKEQTATAIVSANIRALCVSRGFNIQDLADALGQNRTSIGFRWNNRTDWRVEEIAKVAALFGTTPWDLMKPNFGAKWSPEMEKLPRLDSNQQPAD